MTQARLEQRTTVVTVQRNRYGLLHGLQQVRSNSVLAQLSLSNVQYRSTYFHLRRSCGQTFPQHYNPVLSQWSMSGLGLIC